MSVPMTPCVDPVSTSADNPVEWLLGLPDQYGNIASASYVGDRLQGLGLENNVTVSACTFVYRGANTVMPNC